jgi:hypothetical protein
MGGSSAPGMVARGYTNVCGPRSGSGTSLLAVCWPRSGSPKPSGRNWTRSTGTTCSPRDGSDPMFGLETGLESRCGVPLHIIINIDGILAQLFKWAQPQIDAHLRALGMAAEHSGGGIVADVPRQQPDMSSSASGPGRPTGLERSSRAVSSNVRLLGERVGDPPMWLPALEPEPEILPSRPLRSVSEPD